MSLQLLFRDQKWGLYAFLLLMLLLWAPLLRSSTFNEPGSNSGAKTEAKPVFLRLSALGGTLE